MSNRINGDFDSESIEAFRAAYAAQILEPEDQETDQYTGLPTNLVLNTSPWIQHTGLWKANDGSNKDFQANQVLVPGIESVEEEGDLSEEELEELIDELLADEGSEKLLEDEDDSEPYDEVTQYDTDDEDELSDEEIVRMIDELLSEGDVEDDYEDEISEEVLDQLVDELLSEEDVEDDYEDEISEEVLDQMVDDLLDEELEYTDEN